MIVSFDTTMADRSDTEDDESVTTDCSFDSDKSTSSGYDSDLEDVDMHMQESDGLPSSTSDDEDDEEALAAAAAYEEEYAEHYGEELHIFDDGLESDESEDGSDVSSVDEDLTAILAATEVQAEVKIDDNENMPQASSDMLSWIHRTRSSSGVKVEESVVEQAHGSSESATDEADAAPAVLAPVIRPICTVEQLTSAHFIQKKIQKKRDAQVMTLKELHESSQRIQLEIIEAQKELQQTNSIIARGESEIQKDFRYSGVSEGLFRHYNEFCESLQPEYGLREGFSITCESDHYGSYLRYDPELNLFRGCVEKAFRTCNFRSEASLERNVTPATPYSSAAQCDMLNVVCFWPIRSPEPRTGVEKTWGEQYVSIAGTAY